MAAQLVAIGVAPVLTRLYNPQDFGFLASITALSGFLILIAAGRYELAIMLPDDDAEAGHIAGVGLVLSLATAFVTLLGVVGAALWWQPLASSGLSAWALLLPAMVLAGGWGAVFVAYASRKGQFGLVATTGVVRQLLGSATSVVLGLFKWGAGGLLLGGLVSVAAANVRLGRPVFRQLRSSRPSAHVLWATARRYSKFPRQTLPAGVLMAASTSGLPLVIGALFGVATLGVWSLANRMLSLPSAIVSQAVAEPYYRRAVEVRVSVSDSRGLFDRVMFGLAAVSLVPFLMVALFAQPLFSFIFGPEWASAGEYAIIMLPWMWVRFVASPLSRTTLIYERNEIGLRVQAWLLAVLVATSVITSLYSLSFTSFLWILSLSAAISEGLLILVYRGLIREQTPLEPRTSRQGVGT